LLSNNTASSGENGAVDGIKVILDEDVRAGLVDRNLTVDKVSDERILKAAQQELRKEGKLGS